jgi:peroxiredoxin Q/BCP
MYGKEYEGVIRSTVLIDPKGVVRAHWPKASAKGHAAEVLAELKRMG